MAKKQELTIYKNELNTIPFRKFNSVEMNLFFAICTKMRNQELNKIRFSFDDLKELSNYSSREQERFINDIENVYKKMTQLSYRQEDEEKIRYFILFSGFEIDKKMKYVEIRVNQDLEHILNKITGEFTKFELEEFTDLRSSYSKTAFRLLKQFRQTGFWKIKTEDFRNIFDVPKSYPMNRMTTIVLDQIIKELSPIFKGLKIKKIKAKKNRKIEYLEFSFIPQDDIQNDGTKIFKDNDGNYYKNDIEHFTKEEINKSLPITE